MAHLVPLFGTLCNPTREVLVKPEGRRQDGIAVGGILQLSSSRIKIVTQFIVVFTISTGDSIMRGIARQKARLLSLGTKGSRTNTRVLRTTRENCAPNTH